MQLTTVRLSQRTDFEVVERKGNGHPDTLSDGLAEELSREYSRYTLETFGAVLHHNFDKVGLLGGHADVAFGRGRLTAPIRVLVNGRTSTRFGDTTIPVEQIVTDTARRFLGDRLKKIDPHTDLVFHWNLSTGSSPGQVDGTPQRAWRRHWFQPRSLADLRELQRLACNDTSVGCAYAPLSPLERFVLAVEETLHGSSGSVWLGTDIKLLAVRTGRHVELTMCLPQIADAVPDLSSYLANLATARDLVTALGADLLPGHEIVLHTNTRDDPAIPELYLTATGSSIESGDEGLVGRGNRSNGLIATTRPYTMEGVCGKNPVYHTGKVYTVAAQQIADTLVEATGTAVAVWVVGQSGRDLTDPWQVVVAAEDILDQNQAEIAVKSVMSRIGSVTEGLLAGTIRLY